MVVFLIVVGVIAAIIVASVLIYKHAQKIKAFQRQFVKENSARLAKLREINSRYKFYNPKQRELVYEIFLNSKKAFDNFDYTSAIRSTFFDKRLQIKSLMDKVTKDRNLLAKYKAEIKKLPVTDFESLPKVKHMSKDLFCTLEKEFVNKEYLSVETKVSVSIVWSYESPAGRNYYENHRTFNYDKIVEIYFNYFNEDLRNVEENERMSIAIQNVTSELKKDVYRISEIIDLYKKYEYKATSSLAEATLLKAGYVRRKDTDYFIHSSVKNIRDLILCSADDQGLIFYDNQIKDDEYDNAIDKLQKEGRIIPISNLYFLKVSKSLNYRGITLEEIDEFESLLLKYAKKQTFVSLKQIVENIDCLVTRIDFEECFVYTIVKYCGFLFEIPGVEKMFTTIQRPQRIMFLEWLLNGKKSVDAYDLVYDLKEVYGVEYNVYSMIYDIEKNKTKLYYNPEMEKIYSSKDYFFEELEDVL